MGGCPRASQLQDTHGTDHGVSAGIEVEVHKESGRHRRIEQGREAEGRGSSAPSAMVKVREVYKEKLDATRLQIERLRTLEREILASLDYLDTCSSACEPDKLLAACPSCNHHDKEQEVPDLVAGFRG